VTLTLIILSVGELEREAYNRHAAEDMVSRLLEEVKLRVRVEVRVRVRVRVGVRVGAKVRVRVGVRVGVRVRRTWLAAF